MSVPAEHESQSSTTPSTATGNDSVPAEQEHVLTTSSVEETLRIGEVLGKLLEPGDVILLQGDLGTGKTAFTQGIGRGLDVLGTINSPTFTILKEYSGRLPLYHFDLYRLEEPEEFTTLGFEDYFDQNGVCVVEWAERAESEEDFAVAPWPENFLRIHLSRPRRSSERSFLSTARGERGGSLLAAWVQAVQGTAMNGVA
jgi:tRNA threonylcarbamoyladenosine biosynthesis protein TsaE